MKINYEAIWQMARAFTEEGNRYFEKIDSIRLNGIENLQDMKVVNPLPDDFDKLIGLED